MDPIVIAAVVWTICAILGAIIANIRGTEPIKGFFLGLILGPLGVILAAVEKPAQPVDWDR